MGGIRLNTREELSLRQVLAAVALSGLSLAEAQAGALDWRWGLVGVAVSVPLFAWVIMRLRSGPIYKGVYGVALTAVYTGWSALTLGHVLGQAAHRLELTGGSQGVQGWLILLLALPVAWMSQRAESSPSVRALFPMTPVVTKKGWVSCWAAWPSTPWVSTANPTPTTPSSSSQRITAPVSPSFSGEVLYR